MQYQFFQTIPFCQNCSFFKNIFQIEFPIRSSLRILFNQISTPSGLSEWFADNVNLNGKKYTFIWDGDEQDAELLNKKNNQ